MQPVASVVRLRRAGASFGAIGKTPGALRTGRTSVGSAVTDDSTKVRSYSVDLSALSPGQLRERYQSQVGDAWRAEFTDGGAGHTFESTVWNLGAMLVSRNAFPARHVTRTRERTRVDQLDHYHLQVAGATLRIAADGEHRSVPAGSPLFLDFSQPASMHNDAGQNIQVFIPRDALDELLPGPRALHGLAPQGGAAGLVADLLRSLVVRLPAMTIAEGNDAAKGTLQLIAAMVVPTPQTLERARPALEASLLRQACRYIELHLESPDLGPQSDLRRTSPLSSIALPPVRAPTAASLRT